MNSKKVYFILIGVLVLSIGLLGGGVYLGTKLLSSSANELNELKLETNVIDAQESSLSRARQDINKYQDLETIAKTVVPQEKDQARTIRELVKFAQESKVPVTSIAFPTSELGEVKAIPTPTTTEEGGSSTPSAAAIAPISQVKPVEGIKGVYQLEITISNDQDTAVSYGNLLNLLSKLEQNRRTSQVTSLSLQPDPKNRNLLTYTMTINVYIKP